MTLGSSFEASMDVAAIGKATAAVTVDETTSATMSDAPRVCFVSADSREPTSPVDRSRIQEVGPPTRSIGGSMTREDGEICPIGEFVAPQGFRGH